MTGPQFRPREAEAGRDHPGRDLGSAAGALSSGAHKGGLVKGSFPIYVIL